MEDKQRLSDLLVLVERRDALEKRSDGGIALVAVLDTAAIAAVAAMRRRTDSRRPGFAWSSSICRHACSKRFVSTMSRPSRAFHPAHLARVFRKHYRCSVGQYVRRMRVDLAARQLAGSRCSIAEIAAQLGFADQSHFSRVFVKLIGLTPARYRKLHRR